MRQAGKSSLLLRLSGTKYRVAKLDDLDLRTLAQDNPALFFEQYPAPVIVDEAQYAPNLFPEIKLRIDRLREARLHGSKENLSSLFLMTGSEQTEIKLKIRESLGGRLSEYTLHPFSIHELLTHDPHLNLNSLFLRGGWPELHVDPGLRPDEFLNQLIDTFIGKDVARKQGVEKMQSFMKALKLLAARTGQLLNVSEIAAQAGVKSPIMHDWISLLEENFILTQLPSYSANLSKRVVKSKKILMNDLGLATRLQGWRELEPLLLSPSLGQNFETLVYTEILRTRDHFNKRWNLHYWRTKQTEEVDFLIEDERGKIVAIEAKVTGADFNPREYLKYFGAKNPIYVVTLAGREIRRSATCTEIPIRNLARLLLDELA
ncbi:MAG: ATP-binding protein [Deltaproteobacteria bacterium]|nr:ATP-binding protein [Deltaproteobacteria bacterium]